MRLIKRVLGVVAGLAFGLLLLSLFNALWIASPGAVIIGITYLVWRRAR